MVKEVRIADMQPLFKICSHVSINAEPAGKNGGAEYYSKLRIRCKECEITYSVLVWIN